LYCKKTAVWLIFIFILIVQLLDLLHTLHTRAAQIFQWWQKEQQSVHISKDAICDMRSPSIWSMGWQPILQTICILCSDNRKQVRTSALTYLQRALLVHDLQQLSPLEWHSCFKEVLFPLMDRLLEPLNPNDPSGIEETRMRAATLLCKVFLQHLSPLLLLEDLFTPLWFQILNYMDGYMHCTDTKNELLGEAIPESLKNLLLVMETAGVFHTPDGYTRLWALTWEKIDSFLPQLRAEVLRTTAPSKPPQPNQMNNNLITASAIVADATNEDNKGEKSINTDGPRMQSPINSPLWMNSAEPSELPLVVANGSYVSSPSEEVLGDHSKEFTFQTQIQSDCKHVELQTKNVGPALQINKFGETPLQSSPTLSSSPTSRNDYTSIIFETEEEVVIHSDCIVDSSAKN